MAQETAIRRAMAKCRPLPGTVVLLLLAACAGGSSGSGGAGDAAGPTPAPPPAVAPPPPVAVPAPADLPLRLTADSARGAFARALGMSEVAVSLSTVALEALTARLAAAGVETRVAPCESGGSVTISLADPDGSGALSADDIVTATYDACAYPGGRLDGVLRIRVAAVSDTATEQVRRGSLEIVRFTQVDGADTLALRGGISFAFTSTLAADLLEIESGELVATRDGRSEALRDFAYRFTLQQNGSGYDNSATGTLRSESLPGTFRFTQPSTWRAQTGRFPAAGVAVITGPDGTSARLDQFDVSFTEARDGIALLLDLDGNGSFESTRVLPWTDFVDVDYFSPLLRDPRTPRPTAGAAPPVATTPGTSPLAPPGPLPLFSPSTSITPATGRSLGLPVAAEAGGAAYDARRDRVYLADPFGNRVVVLSAETLLPLETIGVGSSPRGLALGSGADELYVALGQGGALAILNLNDRSLRRAELESALGTTDISQVAELRPGKLLVGAGNGALATVDLNDSSRVRVIGGLPTLARSRFEIAADRRAGYAMAEGLPGRIVKLDLTGTEPLPLFFRDIPGDAVGVLNPAGDRLVIGNGTVIDTSGLTLLERGDLSGTVGRTDDHARLLLSATPARLVDGATLGVLQSFNIACTPASGQAGVLSLGSRGAWLLYGPLGQCAFSTATPATAPGLDGPRLLPVPPLAVSRNGRAIQIATSFSERADDLALDDAGGLVYVSLPGVGQVAVVSLAGNTVLARIAVGGEPRRLLLSADRRWLYVALVGTGEVAVVDTTTRLVTARIPLGATFGATLIADLVEVRPDVIVAAARTEAGAFVPLVEARRGVPHDPRRVGAAAGYRWASLVVSPDRSRLYVVENGGPRVVETRDLGAEGYPLLATSRPRDQFSSVFHAISADGSRLWLGGEVLATATLTRLGLAGIGQPVLPTPTTGPAAGAFHSASDGIVAASDPTTFQRVYEVRIVCPDSPLILPGMTFAIGFETNGRVVHSASRDELVMLQPSVGALCVVPR